MNRVGTADWLVLLGVLLIGVVLRLLVDWPSVLA